MTTAFDRLHPVWPLILDFLATPLPKPLSGWVREEAVMESNETFARLPHAGAPGTVSRSDIRAGDLAVLMRCSVAFNQAASQPLYRRIITDRLPELLKSYSGTPAHPQIESKRELLGRVQSLHLEYNQKGREPTYFEIMVDGVNFLTTVAAKDGGVTTTMQAVDEVRQLKLALLTVTLIGPTNLLPKLHTVTVGAIFGSQDPTWGELHAAKADLPFPHPIHTTMASMAECSMAFERLLRSAPLKQFCQRGDRGPLSLPNLITWSPTDGPLLPHPTSPLLTMHFDKRNLYIPSALGERTRWVLEQHDRRKGDRKELTRLISGAMKHVKTERKKGGSSAGQLKFDIACGIDHSLPQGTKGIPPASIVNHRQWCQDIMRNVNASGKHAGDVTEFRSVVDFPPCLTCGDGLREDN